MHWIPAADGGRSHSISSIGLELIVPTGIGWAQAEGRQTLEFHAGDILWCPARRKHWHGAMPNDAVTHVAIQEPVVGSPATWMEKATDEEYVANAARLNSTNGRSFGGR